MARWKPTRAGIRNIWEYDDQVFEFADGRLILRGPNGSGKSNALALLFPFLFDATMSAARMDPFAGGRSMKALLLSADRDGDGTTRRYRYEQRTGYAWLELGDGTRHVTLGCGARASAQRDADAWYFCTDRRPGVDLDLTPGGVPLARARLAEELGPQYVYDTADAYRDAIDRELFGIGRDRYRNLMELVLRLRRPQLAGKLQLDELSKVLSDGLPALDAPLVADVAASFDDLEAVQRDLQRRTDAARAVHAFVAPYTRYLQTLAAFRAQRAVDAERRQRRAERELHAAEQRVVALDGALEDLAAELDATQLAAVQADGRRRAQLESPAYRDATALAEILARAADAQRHAHDAAERLHAAHEAVARRLRAHADAEATHRDAQHRTTRARDDAMTAADLAGIGWTVRDDEPLDAIEQVLRAAAAERRTDLDVVRELVRTADRLATHADAAQDQASTSAARALDAATRLDGAVAARAAEVAALHAQLDEWAARHAAVVESRVVATVAAAIDDPDGPDDASDVPAPALDAAWRAATSDRVEALVARHTSLAKDRDVVERARAGLQAERDRVAATTDPGPDPWPARAADRSARPGAPLYACCDFATPLDDTARAGIEAALEASGLLDAWLLPGGTIDDESLDAFVVTGADAVPPANADAATLARADASTMPPAVVGAAPPASAGADAAPAARADATAMPPAGADAAPPATAGPAPSRARLTDLLTATPPPSSGLEPADVERALASIAARVDLATVAIDTGGRYRLGPLRGRHTKPVAEYIGATARAQRRLRLLAELDERLAGFDAELAELDGSLAAVAAERTALDAAGRDLPTEAALADASRAVVAARAASDEAAARAADDDARAAHARATASDAQRAAEHEATVRRLVAALVELDAAAQRVAGYERAATELVQSRRTALDRTRELERHARDLADEREAYGRRERDHQVAQQQAAELQARADELQVRLGPDAEEPIRALAAIDSEIERLRGTERDLLDRRRTLDNDAGNARARREECTRGVELAGAAAAAAIAALHVLRRRDVLTAVFGAAADAPADAATAAAGAGDPAEVARAVIARTPAPVDESAIDAAEDAVMRAHRTLLDELRDGYDPALHTVDGVLTVEVVVDGGTIGVLDLAEQLDAQLERQRELLSERDREVFERHLLTRVSEALRELLNQATEFVAEINACLRDTPTASGIRIELRWSPASDERAHRDAIALLHRSPELLGPDERERLRAFFARAIQSARADFPGLGYEAVLTQVLDYRSWHAFTLVLRTASNAAQPLTRNVFRTLSGGEQAVALHLPLFAAAAAHYRAAKPDAPRLIALDEAFAGIDERMRGELMGLLVRFDLDVIMTGHELWGAYEEVPAVAVYDLLRRPPAEGVSALGMRWDGARLQPS